MKAITTRFVGPTNTKGSRIVASDEDGNRVIYKKHYNTNNNDQHRKAAEALCDKMGWSGKETLIQGSLKNGYVFVFDPRGQE